MRGMSRLARRGAGLLAKGWGSLSALAELSAGWAMRRVVDARVAAGRSIRGRCADERVCERLIERLDARSEFYYRARANSEEGRGARVLAQSGGLLGGKGPAAVFYALAWAIEDTARIGALARAMRSPCSSVALAGRLELLERAIAKLGEYDALSALDKAARGAAILPPAYEAKGAAQEISIAVGQALVPAWCEAWREAWERSAQSEPLTRLEMTDLAADAFELASRAAGDEELRQAEALSRVVCSLDRAQLASLLQAGQICEEWRSGALASVSAAMRAQIERCELWDSQREGSRVQAPLRPAASRL